jgi:hypothetical protein
MNEERKRTMKVGTKIGAALGVIGFLVFGIVPGFYFGSYGVVVLLSHLTGGPLELLYWSSEHCAWLGVWHSPWLCC